LANASFGVDRVGVHAIGGEFARWGWAFRELHESDFGIVGLVEPFAGGRPSGRYIALQIKSGRSWFEEATAGGWVFRESHDRNLVSWLRWCLPVLLLLHDPETGATYWGQVTPGNAKFTGTGWKVTVPANQVLCAEAAGSLQVIADSAPAAADDPVESSCRFLPPATAELLRGTGDAEPGGTMRLVTLLAAGRDTSQMVAESVISGSPSWLAGGKGYFEIAVATYASGHGHGHGS
jgi:hypothetical protein